jgi:vacuolar protein-sorting-associated protein 4
MSDSVLSYLRRLRQKCRVLCSNANHEHHLKVIVDGEEMVTPCSPGDKGAIEMTWVNVESDKLLEPGLGLKDFVKAVKGARPTVSGEDLKRNAEWTAEFGSEGA